MSFNGFYVNFGCHKKCQLKHIFTIKWHHFRNRVYFVFAKASTAHAGSNTVLLMIDKDIDVYISKDLYIDK